MMVEAHALPLWEAKTAIAQAVPGDPAPIGALLHAHRHFESTRDTARAENFVGSLAGTFPVTRGLLGEAMFEVLACHFAGEHRALGPCPHDKVGGFPGFLAEQPSLKRRPYIGDVARLEWLMHVASRAPESPRVAPGALGRIAPHLLPGLVFALHPSCQLLTSRFVLHDVCRAHRDRRVTIGDIEPSENGERLFIMRNRDGDVVCYRLTRAQSVFLRSLRAGRRFAALCNDRRCQAAGFGPVAWLAGLIDSGAIAHAELY